MWAVFSLIKGHLCFLHVLLREWHWASVLDNSLFICSLVVGASYQLFFCLKKQIFSYFTLFSVSENSSKSLILQNVFILSSQWNQKHFDAAPVEEARIIYVRSTSSAVCFTTNTWHVGLCRKCFNLGNNNQAWTVLIPFLESIMLETMGKLRSNGLSTFINLLETV